MRLVFDSGSHISNGMNRFVSKIKEIQPHIPVIKLKRRDSRFRFREGDKLIHWGNTDKTYLRGGLNSHLYTKNAINKRLTFELLSDSNVAIPMFFITQAAARQYMEGNVGSVIYCRTRLSGHSGEGIVISRTPDELVTAPLYTVGVTNKGEYRVHVFRNLNTHELQVIDITKKRRRTELHEQEGAINYEVRNLDGGWVYCHGNIVVTASLKDNAIAAVAALGLDFGAVDIIHDKVDNIYRVLEVNTAPGLSSDITLTAYATAILQ